MEAHRIEIMPSGEMLLPPAVRQRLHVEGGGSLIIREEGGRYLLEALESGFQQAQAIVRHYAKPGPDVVEEFLAERRAEAERE